jgi:glycosyltransferase involved in cell wall biosynthesis
VGIIRRERELARHVLAKRPDMQFSFFDKSASSFLSINPAWVDRLIGSDRALDFPAQDLQPRRAGVSRLRPFRLSPLVTLTRLRLTTRHTTIRRAADMARRLLSLPRELSSPFAKPRDSRLGTVPIDLALEAPLALGPEVVIVSVGADWVYKDAAAIDRLKRQHGFRLVGMCHDLIPILFPSFFPQDEVASFRAHWMTMLAIADRILVNSRRVEADIRDFCGKSRIDNGKIVLVQPGVGVIGANPALPLPDGLQAGKFVLFVGTIEPRKGHAMLIDVWRRLLAQGLPQSLGFKLVFVGRPGWLVEGLLRQIANPSAFGGTLLHFSGMADEALARLYQGAAFCILPSLYEGFGLPVIEAFAYGKAMIASTGGALPETVGTLSPCLSPTDPEAWFAMIKRWIEDASARAIYEERIRESFSHPNWDQAAASIFKVAEMVP